MQWGYTYITDGKTTDSQSGSIWTSDCLVRYISGQFPGPVGHGYSVQPKDISCFRVELEQTSSRRNCKSQQHPDKAELGDTNITLHVTVHPGKLMELPLPCQRHHPWVIPHVMSRGWLTVLASCCCKFQSPKIRKHTTNFQNSIPGSNSPSTQANLAVGLGVGQKQTIWTGFQGNKLNCWPAG